MSAAAALAASPAASPLRNGMVLLKVLFPVEPLSAAVAVEPVSLGVDALADKEDTVAAARDSIGFLV